MSTMRRIARDGENLVEVLRYCLLSSTDVFYLLASYHTLSTAVVISSMSHSVSRAIYFFLFLSVVFFFFLR